MSRMLILIPMMYPKKFLKELLGNVPEDFEESSSEFWDYIQNKLAPFKGRINAIYSSDVVSMRDLDRKVSIILKLFEDTATCHSIDDPLLLAETEAWLELIKDGGNQVAFDLYEDNMRDRNKHASKIIHTTLLDNEIGLLFTEADRRLPLPEDVKVVKMCPFDPTDYLNRHLAQQKVNGKRKG